MSTIIKPTVGRVVWFYPSARTGSTAFHPPTLNDPLAAIVAKVIGEYTLNLAVFDAHGFTHSMISVPLIQADESVPEDGYFATWMPYQIGQAKKHANELAPAAEVEKFAADLVSEAKSSARLTGAMSQSSQLVGGSMLDYTRSDALNLALRTPGAQHHTEVLAAAKAYEQYLRGETNGPLENKTYADGTKATGPAPLPARSPAEQDAAQG